MIEVIETIEGMAKIEDDWRLIGAKHPSPLLQFDWFRACAAAFCPPDNLHILVRRNSRKITAIAPLSLQIGKAKGRLEILGSEVLCEPSGLIYDDESELSEMLDHVIARHQPTAFRRLPSDAPEIGLLEAKNKGLGFQAERSSGSPWLPISVPWPEYEKSLSSKDRYTLRRARKRAVALGIMEFDFRSPGPEDIQACFDELVRIESLSWKDKNGTSLGSYPQLTRFFSHYMHSAAKNGTLRVNLLKINGTAVAFLMGVVYSKRFWVLKISFAEAFANCSPGVLLMHEVIHSAFEENLDAFEFLGTNEPWLHLWTDHVHQYVGIHLYPLSLRGLINLGSDSSSFILKRIPALKSKSTRD